MDDIWEFHHEIPTPSSTDNEEDGFYVCLVYPIILFPLTYYKSNYVDVRAVA